MMTIKPARWSIAGLVLTFATAANAGQYPERAINLIVPFPPGGVTDVVGRAVAAQLTNELGQPVVVENRAGASGAVGTAAAARAEPDGYTLLLGNISTLGTNPSTLANLAYDPVKDFTPISLLAVQPLVVAVHPSVPARDIGELIRLAKSKPGALTYGTAGSSIHLAVELFNSMNGIDMLHVPYRGSAPAITDLIGGQINVLFDPISTLYPQVSGGQVRGLAVTTSERSNAASELPTVGESATPGYDVSSWQALVAPAGTPPQIVARLNAAVLRVLQAPETRALFDKQGARPSPSSPEQAGEYIRSEVARWKMVADKAGVRPE